MFLVMRSTNYRFTINPSKDADVARLESLRKEVKETNARLRAIGSVSRFRVTLSRRWGKDNPNAWKYDNKHKPARRAEDYQAVDVYMVKKNDRTEGLYI